MPPRISAPPLINTNRSGLLSNIRRNDADVWLRHHEMKYSADDKQARKGPAPPALNHFGVLPADMASQSSHSRCHSLAYRTAIEAAPPRVEVVITATKKSSSRIAVMRFLSLPCERFDRRYQVGCFLFHSFNSASAVSQSLSA